MYTIKIKSVDGVDSFKGIRKTLENKLIENLSKHNITTDGVFMFMGKQNYMTIGQIVKLNPSAAGGNELREYADWVIVNRVINETLDELKIDGYVRNDRYVVRDYNDRRKV